MAHASSNWDLCDEEIRAQAMIYYCKINNISHSARTLEMETRAYFDIAYFSQQMISGDLEDAVCYFTAFVRDEYLPGLGIKDADPIVPMEILFEMRKCQALELAQAGRKDHASQIFAEFIVPLLENYDLAFGGDSMKIGVELAKCISYSKEKLVEIFGNSAERRKELLSLVQHKLFRVPRISRALYFSKKVANMNIMGLLTKSTGEIADTQTIKLDFSIVHLSTHPQFPTIVVVSTENNAISIFENGEFKIALTMRSNNQLDKCVFFGFNWHKNQSAFACASNHFQPSIIKIPITKNGDTLTIERPRAQIFLPAHEEVSAYCVSQDIVSPQNSPDEIGIISVSGRKVSHVYVAAKDSDSISFTQSEKIIHNDASDMIQFISMGSLQSVDSAEYLVGCNAFGELYYFSKDLKKFVLAGDLRRLVNENDEGSFACYEMSFHYNQSSKEDELFALCASGAVGRFFVVKCRLSIFKDSTPPKLEKLQSQSFNIAGEFPPSLRFGCDLMLLTISNTLELYRISDFSFIRKFTPSPHPIRIHADISCDDSYLVYSISNSNQLQMLTI